MDELWRQFEAWLAEHWPDGLASLNPPASDAQIAELERQLGAKLPADYVVCLKIHDGQSGGDFLFDGMEFLSCEEVHRQWRVWKELLDDGVFAGETSEPEAGIKNDWWNPRWIPFTHNGGGDHLCLDLDPAESGTLGQVITMWHETGDRERVAEGFEAYFADFVSGALDGRYAYSAAYGGLVEAEDMA
ncbi:molybdenum cofactor biosynthesis protein MoeA [Chromobacterium vaccinii]|uniref:SMI1/KNR4 family protein n=1 Tax=Chromobacterium vaccinii TaxID=1108595 RepID=UPI000CE94B5D|nr:SMI1/KNR4 family protein [Chromobacterium vaccinii]AVG14979.1 molybdenum cofactor biosynthesis protein MoeA [Chromobacterium vaccinii]